MEESGVKPPFILQIQAMVIFVLERSCARSARCYSDGQQASYCNRYILSVRQFHILVGLELHIMFSEDLGNPSCLLKSKKGGGRLHGY